jgi:hypothetical protein
MADISAGETLQVYRASENAWTDGVVAELLDDGAVALNLDGGQRWIVPAFACRRQAAARAAAKAVCAGARITVYWPGERACFAGRVAEASSALWHVSYDDGDQQV